jgi:DNA mismatch repair protein MutL
MGRITILPPALANQIAAGEIIERPASVVKELVENAIDAGARRVSVVAHAGGTERIIVRDDGGGMSAEDAPLAFARHGTSKIERAEDLVGIATFGFRGEALASIAAAADVELLTRPADADTGTRVRARGGLVVDVAEAGAAPGTQIDVHDLFGALPARRKFLKRPATEFGHIAEVINRMALSAPAVGFTLAHGEREVLNFPPVSGPRDRLLQIVGRAPAAGMIELRAETPMMAVEAYVGHPEHSLSSARLVLTYVDGRFVRDRVLTRAVLDGYESVLMRGRYPIAVVFLRVSRGEVDVNVHPAKTEVRFRDSGRVHKLLAGGIAARLREALRQGGVPSRIREGHPASAPEIRDAPGRAAGSPLPPSRAAGLGGAWQKPPERSPRVAEERLPYRPAATAGTVFTREGTTPLAEDMLAGAAGRFFGSLRILGQVLDGYLVCAGSHGLVLIDQHAAHERIRFEQLRRQLTSGAVAVQRLLVPLTLTLGVRDLQALDDASQGLARLGFEGERFGDGTYLLRAVPTLLSDADCSAVLRDVAAERAEIGASHAAEEAIDGILASVACHSAVRVGRRLDHAESAALLRDMDRVDLSGFCPHGRPAFIELDAATLERMFKR